MNDESFAQREQPYFRILRNIADCFKHVIDHHLISLKLPKFGRNRSGSLERPFGKLMVREGHKEGQQRSIGALVPY